MKLVKLLFLLFFSTIFLIACRENKKEEVRKIQIGFTTAAIDSDPYYIFAKNFSEIVDKKTNGRIKIEVKGGGQLGQEGEMFTGMQIGTTDMAVMTNAYVSGYIPAAGLFDLPFIFKNNEEAARILDGKLGIEVLNEYEKFGIKALAYGEGGFRHLVTLKNQVKKPEDFKGLKIRCMETESYIATYAALGTNAVPMAWSETITGLQQGTIDGLDIPISVIYANGFSDIAKDLNLTGHFYSPLIICMSKKIFDSFDENDKKILIESAKEAGQICRDFNKNSESKMLEEMKAQGMEIVDDVDIPAFQNILKDFYSKRSKNIGGNYMEKFNKYIDKIIFTLIAISFIILILSCVLQVFTRFILNNSLSWTEELSRYAFIWSNFLGAIFCTKKGTHAIVTIITDSLEKKKKIILNIVINLIVAIINLIVIVYGFNVAYAVRTQLSPALRVSMSFVYGAAPFSALFILYYSLFNIIKDYKNFIQEEGKND